MTYNPLQEYEPFQAFLLIGTNIGQREKNLEEARKLIDKHAGPVIRNSSVYESAAWGKEDQNNFLNQVLIIETQSGPWELLNIILEIEKQMGRERKEKWAERIIDIDILYFDEVIVNSFDLVVPHPEIPNRRFTLEPLNEIARDKIHPGLKKSQRELLQNCKDTLWVKKLS